MTNNDKQNSQTYKDQLFQSYFKQVPLEDDTTILSDDVKQIEELPVLLQVWAWDGLTACSAVIPKEFSDCLPQEELIQKLRREIKIDNAYTISDSEKFTFINYAFCH